MGYPVGLAAVLVAAIGIGLFYVTFDPFGPDSQIRGTDGVQVIEALDVDALTTQLVNRLSQSGVVAQSDPLGAYRGVNARIPEDKRAELAPDLAKMGVKIPSDGVLTLEIRIK